jgi:uncharacterized membrane protein
VTLYLLIKIGEMAARIVDPLAEKLPYSPPVSVMLVYAAGLLLGAAMSFLAGLLAQRMEGKQFARWLEDRFLLRFPPYAMARTVGQQLAGLQGDAGRSFIPVLVRNGDDWEIGLQSEPAADGYVTVFMPEVPNPWTGTVRIVAADRVYPVDMPLGEVLRGFQGAGRGITLAALFSEKHAKS